MPEQSDKGCTCSRVHQYTIRQQVLVKGMCKAFQVVLCDVGGIAVLEDLGGQRLELLLHAVKPVMHSSGHFFEHGDVMVLDTACHVLHSSVVRRSDSGHEAGDHIWDGVFETVCLCPQGSMIAPQRL